MLKIFERSGIKGTQLNTIKSIYIKSKSKIKLKGEKLKAIPLKSGPARATRHLKEVNRIQIGKKEAKLLLFTGDMIAYVYEPKYFKREI